jgi:hypothetical protein
MASSQGMIRRSACNLPEQDHAAQNNQSVVIDVIPL